MHVGRPVGLAEAWEGEEEARGPSCFTARVPQAARASSGNCQRKPNPALAASAVGVVSRPRQEIAHRDADGSGAPAAA